MTKLKKLGMSISAAFMLVIFSIPAFASTPVDPYSQATAALQAEATKMTGAIMPMLIAVAVGGLGIMGFFVVLRLGKKGIKNATSGS